MGSQQGLYSLSPYRLLQNKRRIHHSTRTKPWLPFLRSNLMFLGFPHYKKQSMTVGIFVAVEPPSLSISMLFNKFKHFPPNNSKNLLFTEYVPTIRRGEIYSCTGYLLKIQCFRLKSQSIEHQYPFLLIHPVTRCKPLPLDE